MACFDCHSFCARCHDKGKAKDPCLEKPDTTECKFCSAPTPEQHVELGTPSYKIKMEKCEVEKLEASSTPVKDNSSLVDPSTVSVFGAVDDQGTLQSSTHVEPPEKKLKKDKATTFKSVKPAENKSTTETKIAELYQKWSQN